MDSKKFPEKRMNIFLFDILKIALLIPISPFNTANSHVLKDSDSILRDEISISVNACS